MIPLMFLQSIGPRSTLGTGIIMLSLTFKSTNRNKHRTWNWNQHRTQNRYKHRNRCSFRHRHKLWNGTWNCERCEYGYCTRINSNVFTVYRTTIYPWNRYYNVIINFHVH
jgi:hypothetical protein